MKRACAMLLSCALLILLPAGCGEKDAADNITFTAVIEEINDNSILVSTTEDTGFDKASVGFGNDVVISFDLHVGQTVKLTILPEIRESYPVQVTATAIELISDAPEPEDGGQTAYPVSYIRADSADDDSLSFLLPYIENGDTLILSSVQHLPAMRFEDAGRLQEFVKAGREYFQFDTAYGDGLSFAEAAADYDDAFFADHDLIVLYVSESSGSNRHSVESVSLENGCLSVSVRRIVPEIGTTDMADWFIAVEIPKADLGGCDYTDAYITQE